jgi:hypothetical protein
MSFVDNLIQEEEGQQQVESIICHGNDLMIFSKYFRNRFPNSDFVEIRVGLQGQIICNQIGIFGVKM